MRGRPIRHPRRSGCYPFYCYRALESDGCSRSECHLLGRGERNSASDLSMAEKRSRYLRRQRRELRHAANERRR